MLLHGYKVRFEPREMGIALRLIHKLLLILISLGNCMISSIFREQTCWKMVKRVFCSRLQRLPFF